MFWTDLLSIIISLNTVFTAIGICHTEVLKMAQITSVCIYICTNTYCYEYSIKTPYDGG
jgi:hypothetical protein